MASISAPVPVTHASSWRALWLRHQLRSPCCCAALDDVGAALGCLACGCRYPVRGYGPDLMPLDFDRDPAYPSWRRALEGLARWRQRTWNGKPAAARRTDDTIRLIGAFLARAGVGGRVLDVGCGGGWVARVCRADPDGYVGLDPEPSPPVAALSFVRAVSDRLPWAPAVFDSCVFVSSLDYSLDPAASIREAHRVLKPGGVIAIATPIHRSKTGPHEPVHHHRFVRGEVEAWLAAAFVGRPATAWPRENYQLAWIRKPR